MCLGGILLDRQAVGAADPRVQGAWLANGITQMDDQQHAIAALLPDADGVFEEVNVRRVVRLDQEADHVARVPSAAIKRWRRLRAGKIASSEPTSRARCTV